jgi:hypothetical protein
VGTYEGGHAGDWLVLRPGGACVQGWVTGPGEASLHDCTWRQDGRHVELHGVDFGRHDAPWRSDDKALFIRRMPTGYISLSCCMDIPTLTKADTP